MALLDLSLVTRALIRVIQAHVSASGVWTGAGASLDTWTEIPVAPLPPDQLQDGFLGVYLYHVGEDPHFKNTAGWCGTRPWA